MGQEHEQVQIILVALVVELPGNTDGHQIDGIGSQQSEQRQDQAQQAAQWRTQHRKGGFTPATGKRGRRYHHCFDFKNRGGLASD